MIVFGVVFLLFHVLSLGELRLEIDGSLVEFVHEKVVDGVDVIERVVFYRLQDHGLVQTGKLEHMIDYGFIQLQFFFGARVYR